MSSFDEYRKKLQDKYGTRGSQKSTSGSSGTSTSAPSAKSNTPAKQTGGATAKKSSFDTYKEKMDSKYRTDKVDEEGVKKWFSDAGSAIERYDGGDRRYSSNAPEIDDLLRSSSDVYNYFLNHRDEIEDYDAWEEALSSYRSALMQQDKQNYDAKNYFTQGRIEEVQAKLDWYRKNNSTVILNSEEVRYGTDPFEVYGGQYDEEIKALEEELEELQAGKWRVDKVSEYGALNKNADFDELSTTVSEKPTALLGIQLGEKWLGIGDLTYDYINDLGGAREREDVYRAENADNPHLYKYSFMTDEEIANYNYLYQAEGKNSANEYLEYLSYELDARRTQKLAGDSAEFAKEHPVLSSLYSVPANLVSGVGMLDIAGQNATKRIKEAITGEYAGPINYNSMAMGASVQSATIRSTVAQSIADSTGTINLDTEEHPILSKVLNGKSLGDVYQLGMSMADSATVAALSPIIGSAGLALLGGSAGTQGVLAAVEAGADDEQALTMGVLNAAFEMLFEKVSLDNLLKGNTRSIVKAVFQQGLVEGTEELNTTLFNNIADILVMAEHSDYQKNIAAYMEQGYSEEEATKQALLDMAVQMGWDFVGGMLSGGVMGGSGAVVNTVQQNREAQRIYGTEVSALIDEALDIDPQNPLAIKLKERLDAGKNISGGQIYDLVQENEAGMVRQDMADIQGAATARLAELGETGDVHAIGAALAKQAAGQSLTRAERQAIANSKYGQRVSNELNAENVRSGEYSSEWAGRIGTSRINAEEYNAFVEAAQIGQEPAEASEGTVIAPTLKAAQESAQEPTVADNATAQKKQTVETVEVAEESPAAQEPEAKESTITLEDASKKYGAQAGAMVHTFKQGQDVAKYDAAYQQAYNMGKSGVSFSYAKDSEVTAYLTEKQRELAYEAGKAASDTAAREQDAKNKAAATGKTGRVKGTVKGEGVTIADLKKTFNDTQGKAYKVLSTYAEATGVNIVLYKSEAGPDGKFQGAQGKYRKSEPGTIYIDINAGLSDVKGVDDLAKYAMLRTFAHEFTHFIENWNPIQYNEFRKVVFDTLTQRGENVNDLIEEKMASGGLEYDAASREVVAEAMTDILPDANFVQELAEKHKTIFQKLLEKLKEFVQNLKDYYNSIGHNRSREANALKEQVGDAVKYVESIVKLFDNVAVQAVENYQATVATEEVAVAENETTTTVSELETVVKKPKTPNLSGKKVNRTGDTITVGDPAKATREVEITVTDEEWDAIQKAIPETVTEPPKTVATKAENGAQTASERLAEMVLANYLNDENINHGRKMLTSRLLYVLADEAFGGTQAEGAYNRKDAYDAMELAVNKYLLQHATEFNGDAESAVEAVKYMESMLELLPTQNVRTQEMEDFQQFSTPPNIAYLAAWAANIRNGEMVLEPSAGIGGLAVFAKAWGAEVAVNELSKRRLEVLRAMGFDHLFNENAEQIDNILPESISPSVVIMNPPFSSTAGRTANNKTSNAEKHIDQALARLRDGGRLVAVLGKSMNDQDYYRYWDKLRKSFNIRANLSIDGSNYKKYGTTWGVQIVVIDKTGPQTGETVTGKFTDLTEIPNVLEGIRNDRSNVEENRAGSSNDSIRESVADGRNGQSDTGHQGGRKRSDGGSSDTQRNENRKSSKRAERTGNRTVREGVAETGGAQTERQDGGTDRAVGYADPGDGNAADQRVADDRAEPELSSAQLTEIEEVSDDGVYATFIAPDIPVKGGKKHPAVLVESAAMAAVSMPKATYIPKLPADVVKNNLSDAQLVTVTYAGQAHEQKLPDGRRKGFFVGDGTGVGKGRQIAGIILDNFMQGRKKAVWISKNNDLFGDAIRDWTATTGRSKDEVISHSKIKPKDRISLNEGILYSTYDTIKSEKGGSRLDQIVEWLGEDFDGVIAFDEAHNMGNLFGKRGKFGKSKGSEKARAGVELQRRLPNARIVYVSATAATEVDNLAYAERVGLWGQGTAFSTAQDFISKIGASGLAAMELVIRDMKAMGTYVARSISYNGVNYDTVEHALDPMQTEIYNTMSRAWQKTMQNVQSALETTGGQYNSTERQRALGNFYSAMQLFYNQVLTSMSMPSVIADMRRELAAGHSCVLQIVNTNEAQQNKQLAEAKAAGESLDNLDLTPREALVGYLTTSFPTQMFEEYTDDDGNLRSRPVLDSAGNPVQNKAAVRQRDALIAEVNQMSIPDGPLEMLFDAFGPEAVAENTGRSRRVVPKKQADGTITRVEERRTLNHRTADVQAFQDGKKRILVFSDAGGTGKSYHADRTEKNQQLRVHYVLQPGWVASNAVQGFGRTHRSNEALPPVYKLVTTNIKGQKRFTSTIARRLDQLGALTKGQRDTGSGMFGAKDNLETDLAKDSLREFYRRLGKNQIEGIDGMKTLDRLGLKQKFTDEYGAFKINDNLARDIGTFLNRILALEVDEQNVVFDAFISIYEMELEAAIQAGTLDTGMENVKADRIEVVDDKVIREDKNTGAATHYIQAKTYTKPRVVTTVAEMEQKRSGFVGIYRTESGAVKAVYRIADKTTDWGAIQKQFRLVGPNQGARNSVWSETTLQTKAEAVDRADWQKEWDAEVAKVPEYNEDTLHMLTGALLPIWNSLPQEGNTKVKRLIAHDGSAYLGRVIDKDDIDGVLKGFSIGRTMEVFTAEQVMDKALNSGTRFYLTNDRVQIFRSRVSGEWRLEIAQPYNSWYLTRRYPGIMQERISYRDRYFIPVGEKGIPLLEKLLSDNPVRNTAEDTEQYQSREYLEGESEYDRAGVQRVSTEAHEVSGGNLRISVDAGTNRGGSAARAGGKAFAGLGDSEKGRLRNVVREAIYNSDNFSEVRLAVASYLDKTEYEMTKADWNKAYMLLAEELYDAIQTKPVVEVENLYGYLTEDISSLIRSIRPDAYGDIQFQQRTDTLTDREVLEIAADTVKVSDLTDGERDALRIFQERLSKLRQLQEKRKDLGATYKEQQFGPDVDRKAAAETLNRMHILDSQIKKASADVLSVEDKAVLKRVLQKARKVVEQQEREHGKEVLNRWRERRNNAAAIKKYRERIRGDVDELTNWVLHPDNKNVVKHIPDALKSSVVPFLSSINFMSKQSLRGGNSTAADKAFMEQLRRLAKVMEKTADIDEMYSNYTDLPPDFTKNLRNFMDTAQEIMDNNTGEFIINQMTAEELQQLSKLVRTLKKYIMQMNRFHVNAMFQHVYEAGDNTIDYLAQLKPAENTGTISEFVLWQQIRPAYAFERFGEGGMAIYDGLRRGQATLAFNTKKIQAFAEKAYTAAEVKAWEDQVKTIRLGPGKSVKMRVSQIMSLYELNKREQAKGHILGDGIRVATFKSGREKISDVGQTLTPGELNLILRELTPRQIEVADKLQQFMQQQGGEWGNHVSVARFGEKQFGEENYFPINSDGRHLSVDADEHPAAASLYALLNMGFTKQTQEKAKNRIIVYSIFDVFANHMASMAQYNAFALPVVDALKWFNYQRIAVDEDGSKTILGSVREQMDRAYGVPEESRPGSGRRGYAQNFIINILKAFNGTEAQGVPTDAVGVGMQHRYNMAQVAFNVRVVMQQPLAITRAALLVDYGSIMKGMKLSPGAVQKNVAEMQKYSGIAAWKGLGFYDINISRGLTEIIKHDTSVMDKIDDIGMKGAEKADLWTWAAIWGASKEEVIKKQRLKPGDEGFYEAVTKLFEDVIYKTQVVDSVLTKNEYMRSKGFWARFTSSFMSEPTTTASMLIDAYDKFSMDMQRGMSFQQAWKKNRGMIARVAYVYAIGQVLVAAVQAVADAWRDDDDYQTFMEKVWEAFKGNIFDEIIPLNKLPYLSQAYELAKELVAAGGFDIYGQISTIPYVEIVEKLTKGVEIIVDNVRGEKTNYGYYAGIYKLFQAVSGATGLPMAAFTREAVAIWNNIVGAMAPSLKVKTYEPSEQAQIKYAYQDGYLTDKEATTELLAQGLVENEDEAYWTIQGWEAGEGYSRYDALHDAIRNGGDFDAAMDELTTHGYTEKDVISHIKSKVGEWYKNGEITDTQAKNMLTKYTDMSSEDVATTVNEWSAVVTTGIELSNVKDEYIAGNITASQAKSMRMRYGGDTEEEATEKITKWNVEKEYGFAYEDRATAYKNGEISADELRTVLMEVGGKTYEDADLQVQVYDWQMEVPECDDITASAIEDYNNYCAPVGISRADYYDAWTTYNDTPADYDDAGDSIPYSKTIKVMPYINSLPLTAEQKTALALCWWAESTVNKYRLW